MHKWIVAVFVLVAVLCGCEALVTGLRTGSESAVNVGEDLQESANPYANLIGLALGALGVGGVEVARRLQKKHNLAERDLTEGERKMFEDLAIMLATAIKLAKAEGVKAIVKDSTKHSAPMKEALETILAKLPAVPQQ